MISDLNIPVHLSICGTVRESDGLAMSSRNTYLTDVERVKSSCLYKALLKAKVNCEKGNASTRKEIIRIVTEELKTEPLVTSVEYVSVSSPVDMKESDVYDENVGAVLSSAIRIGTVRLIDNLLIGKAVHLVSQPALHYSNHI